MDTLIKNGTLVTASDTMTADLWLDNGKIAAITAPGAGALGKADKEIDATGKYVIPGGVDVHTHLDMPFGGSFSNDDFESGGIAAAHGGTTTLIDFAIQAKGQALREGLDTWHQKAEGKATIDYGFHMIVTDAPDAVLEEMGSVVEEGVTSFKLFQAYPGVLYLDDGNIFKTMVRARELGAMVAMHAEVGLAIDVLVAKTLTTGDKDPIYHGLSRPEIAEASATERTIALAEMAGTPCYIVHLTCQRALEEVMRARDRGLPVFAETCPQYLYRSQDDPRGTKEDPFEGAKYVCSPPVRPAENHAHLWRGLKLNDLQVVSTDHCPFNFKGQKEMGREHFSKIPNGMPSIETRMHLMYEAVAQGQINLNRFVEVTSTAPAKLFGLYPQKGNLGVGADADVVIWDPKKPLRLDVANMHMNVDYSPYEGMEVSGSPTHTFSRGELIVADGKFLGKAGRGQFLRRKTFSE